MGFSARSEEEYKAAGDMEGFGLLPDDTYIFEVVKFVNKGKIVDRFDKKNDPPRQITDVRYYVKPIAYEGDSETPLIDDVTQGPLNPEKTIQIFFKPESLGFGPAGPSKNRKFLAAALGRPLRDRFDNVEFEDLIGGRFIGDVQRSDDGKYDNIVDFRPLKKAARPRPQPVAAKPEPTVIPEEDDDLPF